MWKLNAERKENSIGHKTPFHSFISAEEYFTLLVYKSGAPDTLNWVLIMFHRGSSFPLSPLLPIHHSFIQQQVSSLGDALNSSACAAAYVTYIQLWLYAPTSVCVCVAPAVHFIVTSRLETCIGQQTDSCCALGAAGCLWRDSHREKSDCKFVIQNIVDNTAGAAAIMPLFRH